MNIRCERFGNTVLWAASAVLCACGSGEVRARGATVEYDTIGDTVVARVQGPALWGENVTLQEEVRIGELEGADAYTFGNVVSMTVAGDGALYVLDEQAKKVRKYDATGRHVLDIGRSGSGPGELKQPHSLDFLPDGRLAVRDFGNARINFYNATGESVGTLIIPGGFYTSTPMHIDTAGRIYTSVIADRVEGQMFKVGFQRFDADGKVQDTIRNPRPDFQSASLIARSPDGTGTSASSVPFTPNVNWTLDRAGNVVWGINNEYAIHTIRDGRPFRITRVVDPVPVQAAEKTAEEERVRRNMKRTQPNWTWQGPSIPDTKPFFRSVMVAHDGRLWVQATQPGVRQPPDTTAARERNEPPPIDRWIEPLVYDVYEPDGQWLARIAMPERFRPMYLRGNHIWGVQRDEFDVNYVVRLRIAH
jgi:sugar lactone lactonase YvrE